MTDATTNAVADSHLHEDGSIERLTIDTIRTLSMDAVQQANSGHPGTPMRSPRSVTPSGPSSSVTIPPTPTGPIATASCCRSAMPRCCSTR